MKAKLEEVERPLRVPRSMPELELHELQVASLYGEEYRIAYEARVTEVARTLAEELYQDPDFAAAHDGVAQDEALAWLTDLAESMIEEALGTSPTHARGSVQGGELGSGAVTESGATIRRGICC